MVVPQKKLTQVRVLTPAPIAVAVTRARVIPVRAIPAHAAHIAADTEAAITASTVVEGGAPPIIAIGAPAVTGATEAPTAVVVDRLILH